MKLTEKKLKQMILEAMISPSALIDDVLEDPDVHPKIKDLLAPEKSEEEKRQGMELLHTLYPDKYPSDGADHVHLGSKEYKDEFEIRNDPSYILEDQVKSELREFAKQLGGKQYHNDGFSIYVIEDGIVEVGTHSGGRTMMELDAFSQFLEQRGYSTGDIFHEDGFGKRQYYFKVMH